MKRTVYNCDKCGQVISFDPMVANRGITISLACGREADASGNGYNTLWMDADLCARCLSEGVARDEKLMEELKRKVKR